MKVWRDANGFVLHPGQRIFIRNQDSWSTGERIVTKVTPRYVSCGRPNGKTSLYHKPASKLQKPELCTVHPDDVVTNQTTLGVN